MIAENYTLRQVKIEPGLPEDLIKTTFEGNLLWGLLRLRLDETDPDGLVALKCDDVRGEGAFYYSIGSGTLQWWLDAAERSGSDLAKACLPIMRKGDEHHLGAFDFNEWKDESGELLVTIPVVLKSILATYGDRLDNSRFVVKVSPSQYSEEFSGSAAFVTASHIESVDLVCWLAEMERKHALGAARAAVTNPGSRL
ncbi:hypothetical protein GOB57_22030 [Sinorhizobium meliloti]|nr:hypothetical protein [Sinorhizobium meliloti]